MELTDCHFTYNNVSSSTYGVKLVNCNTSRNVSLNGKTKTVSAFSSRGNKNYYVADSFSDSPLSFDAEIMTDSEEPLTTAQIKNITSWLFNKKGYYKLYLDSADDCAEKSYTVIDGVTYRYYLNCRMINPSKLEGNGGIVGFKFTIETDSCCAWVDTITKTFTSPSSSIVVNVESDMNEYVYPTEFKVTMGSSGGDFTIINTTDDSTRYTKFTGIGASASVIMNSMTNMISGDSTGYYTKFAIKNFVRLLPGTNSLAITGDIASIEIKWNSRKYI